MKRDYIPGSTVFVVQRDDFDVPVDVSGYMFLACVNDYAILYIFIGDSEDLEETLEYHKEETAKMMNTDCIVVYPLSDCYTGYDFAEAAMREELEDITND